MRSAISAADAVIVSTPEYAHELPGVLKNALDWLVGGMELTDKPVAMFNASARSVYAQTALREVLLTMGARFIDPACTTVPLLAESRTPQQLAADPAIAAQTARAFESLADHIAAGVTTATQPTGRTLHGWQPRPRPERLSLRGRYCAIEPLETRHADALYSALCAPSDVPLWTYLSAHPPANSTEWRERLERYAASQDPLFFTLSDETGRAAGMCAYLRIAPENGSIEIGCDSPDLRNCNGPAPRRKSNIC